ncbi:MAG: sigma-54 dependent transcriptional regulator [Flavobacteriaceae bacterium]|nr:sigma-54 dependent transcriptional regulator [Flavobacteriaceae bacterium]
MSNILLIEDEDSIRRVLKKVLQEDNQSYKFTEATDGQEGISTVKKQDFDLILCDIKMPKKDGIEVLDFIRNHTPTTPVVMISGHGNLETAVKAMRMGAFDYISKPPDLNHLLSTVRSALQSKVQPAPVQNAVKKPNVSQQMVGESDAMQRIHKLISKVAPTQARVLVQGPNGSGKELIADAIHKNSLRHKGPFVEVNCAAIPSELIESELFGHVKGAFTSAHKDRKGKFEAAHGGTLFLDEIGDMSLPAQAKVLRALQEHKVQRVGSDKEISVDVRVVAATNKNLMEEINARRFREDLFHRLAVIEIQVPPLNDRRSDIPLLIDHFNTALTPPKSIEQNAVKLLTEMIWTGNVRQLRNVVERLHILSDDRITADAVKQFVNH